MQNIPCCKENECPRFASIDNQIDQMERKLSLVISQLDKLTDMVVNHLNKHYQ